MPVEVKHRDVVGYDKMQPIKLHSSVVQTADT